MQVDLKAEMRARLEHRRIRMLRMRQQLDRNNCSVTIYRIRIPDHKAIWRVVHKLGPVSIVNEFGRYFTGQEAAIAASGFAEQNGGHLSAYAQRFLAKAIGVRKSNPRTDGCIPGAEDKRSVPIPTNRASGL